MAWMMGIRKVDELSAWESGLRPDSASGSSSSEKSAGSEIGEGSEFIAVAKEHDGHNVWKS